MFKKIVITNAIILTILLSTNYATAMGSKPLLPNSLEELSANYELPKPIKKDKQVIIKDETKSLIFHAGSRRLLFNDTLIMMNGPLTIKNKAAFLDHADITDTLSPLLAPKELLKQYPIKTVIIDPGHGGSDPGTVGRNGTKEKDVVLDIAKRCQKKLQALGINATITRTKDKFIKLKDRPKKAAKQNADLFISIHVNASRNRAANGIETHILPASGFPCTAPSRLSKNSCKGNQDNKMSVLLAYSVQKSTLASTGSADRGVRRSRFSVLRNAPCPALLIECGFLSNKAEQDKLSNSAFRDKLATGIANGIKELLSL